MLISVERAEEVFVVVPAAYGHNCGVYVLQIRQNVSFFPELIVVRMRHHLVPEINARSQLLLIKVAGIFYASHLKIEFVAVLRSPSIRFDSVLRRLKWLRARMTEECIKIVVLCEKESAVVV